MMKFSSSTIESTKTIFSCLTSFPLGAMATRLSEGEETVRTFFVCSRFTSADFQQIINDTA